ncbi:MAG: galactose-1-phosphate uridylyltransferase [Nitrososphaerales archaeon]
MTELRQEPTTREWVIVATERSRRPHDFKPAETPTLPRHDKSCPFCPGQEHLTPPEVLSYRDGRGGWTVRGFSNQFPVLAPRGSLERSVVDGHFLRMSGVGVHEVIVETPRHNGFIPSRTLGEVELMLKAYRERHIALRGMRAGRAMVIFKNEGVSAGASVIHPHSQLVVTPLVPPNIEMKLRVAEEYFKETGRCVYRDAERWEVEAGRRLVLETDLFTVFTPYASRSPFETWVIPKRDGSSFAEISDEGLSELAQVLKDVVTRLYKIFGSLDYNWVVHTAPFEYEDREDYLWHIQIQPRLTVIAGFEMGAGMYINTVLPEDAAASLREVASTV